MEAYLIINGVDFSPYLLSEGLRQTEVLRQGREVVGLDGVSHRSEIRKRGISVELTELRDDTWYRLLEALRDRPVEARYADDRLGDVTKLFYVSGPSAAAKTVRGGRTYFSGGSFELEEK